MRLPAILLLLSVGLSAQVVQAHGDLHEQIHQLSEKLRSQPNDAELWHKRGELYRAHGDHKHALADYTRAERLNPALHVVHLSRGRTLLEAGRLGGAEESLSHFLQLIPGHTEALLLRARVRVQLRRHDQAEQDYAVALAGSGDPLPDLYIERANNLVQLKRIDDALSVLEDGKKRLGALVTLDDTALSIELSAARYANALKRVDAMLAQAPRGEHLLARKAQILELAGDREAARNARESALALIAALPEAKQKIASTQRLKRELEAGLLAAKRL